jgi:hypothetical protein
LGNTRARFVSGASTVTSTTGVDTVTLTGLAGSATLNDVRVHAVAVGSSTLADDEWFTVFRVELTNIKFNHDTASSASDALNIRRDYNTPFDISNGEWVKGVTNIPVCYTTNKAVTIKARFTVQPAGITSADIWALSTDSGGSLGDVIKTNVTFVSGVASDVVFLVSGTTPNCIQKTTNDVWQWKMENANESGSPVCDMNTSGVHTVYTILNDPVAPWDNAWNVKSNAWVTALDYSCVWAGTKQTRVDAQSSITRSIYDCGRFVYDGPPCPPIDPPQWGQSRYMDPFDGRFKLSQCLAELQGTSTNAVNCTDCGRMVMVFANLVGGRLWSSKMYDPNLTSPENFRCNQVVVIGAGSGMWAEPFGGNGFSYHEVGWEDPATEIDAIYDACLKVDGDGAPSSAPRTELYPTNMIFSDGNQGSPYVYRERLAQPGPIGYGRCAAQPGERERGVFK